MNESFFQKETVLSPGFCDFEGKLAYHEAFRLFMDLASSHADALGIGMKEMQRRGLFWLTVKTKIRFYDRPRFGDAVTIATWPEAPGRSRGNRSYELRNASSEILLAGKTEWAVIDLSTRRITPIAQVYPASLRFDRPSALPEPFEKLPDDFGEDSFFAQYRVSSSDIDLGGHMNNAAYLRALLGSFESGELRKLPIGAIEVIFRAPCFEGETLQFERKPAENGLYLRASCGGETRLLAAIMK